MLDIELYGGKRGLIEHSKARVLFALGLHRNVRNINWTAVCRLVFVCAGNICRSPYASARARSLGVAADSFGLQAADGAPADPVAARNALLRGVDLSSHCSAKAEPPSFSKGDLIVVFEPGHLPEIVRLTGGEIPVSLLGVWVEPVRPHLQDPYGRGDRYFQECFSVIDANVTALAQHMARHGNVARSNGTRLPGPSGCDRCSHDRTST